MIDGGCLIFIKTQKNQKKRKNKKPKKKLKKTFFFNTIFIVLY